MKPFEIKGLRPPKPLSRGNLCGNYSMKASFGPLQVNLRYTYSRKGTLYYQRPISKELQSRYGKKLVKVKLKSADVLLASREVDRLNRQVEAEWERLRAEPTSSSQALTAHAVSLLRDWGLADQPAKNDPSIVEVFFDFLDGKRPNHAVEDEDQRAQPNPVEYLSDAAGPLRALPKPRNATNSSLRRRGPTKAVRRTMSATPQSWRC